MSTYGYNTRTSVPKIEINAQFGPDPLTQRLTPHEHTKLVKHIMRALHRSEDARQERMRHMVATEIDLLGIVEPTGSDCERKEKRDKAEDVSIPDAIYPWGYMSLLDFSSEVTAVVMPMEAPYAIAVGGADQKLANSLVKAFRSQGARLDHRNNVQASIFDMISLDQGAIEYSWHVERAPGSDPRTLGEGNAGPNDIGGVQMKSLNPYNITYDQTVEVADLALEGEFVATFDKLRPFHLRRKHGVEHFLSGKVMQQLETVTGAHADDPHATHEYNGIDNQAVDRKANWFHYEPYISRTRQDVIDRWGSNRTGGSTDMSGIFSGVPEGQGYGSNVYDPETLHYTKIFMRIQPSKWGLVRNLTKKQQEAENFEIWEMRLYGPGYLGYARRIDYGIDRFPIQVATMNFRRRFHRSIKYGEHAAQMGLLISTLTNMYKRSLRKGLEGGLTVYNADVLNLNDISETAGGRVPINMNRHDDDIGRHIKQFSDLPDTKGTISAIEASRAMLGDFLPSSANPAMVGLDRATTYQAQAVMATSQTSLLYFATLVDGQVLVPGRIFMHRLNLQHPQDLKYIDESKQALVTLTETEIAQAEFEFIQSQPLMGVDRIRAEQILRDMVNVMMQSGGQLPPVAAYMMKHYVEIAGVKLDVDEYMAAAQEEIQAARQQREREAAEAGGAPNQEPAPNPGPAPVGGVTR